MEYTVYFVMWSSSERLQVLAELERSQMPAVKKARLAGKKSRELLAWFETALFAACPAYQSADLRCSGWGPPEDHRALHICRFA